MRSRWRQPSQLAIESLQGKCRRGRIRLCLQTLAMCGFPAEPRDLRIPAEPEGAPAPAEPAGEEEGAAAAAEPEGEEEGPDMETVQAWRDDAALWSSWTGVWWHGDKKDRSLYI